MEGSPILLPLLSKFIRYVGFCVPHINSQRHKFWTTDQVLTQKKILKGIPTVILAHTEPHLQECHAQGQKKNDYKQERTVG